jgi:hypothetical protein
LLIKYFIDLSNGLHETFLVCAIFFGLDFLCLSETFVSYYGDVFSFLPYQTGTVGEKLSCTRFSNWEGCTFVSAGYCAIFIFLLWMEQWSNYLPTFPAQALSVGNRISFRWDQER